MKAKEFTINVPINITIDGDGDPKVDMGQNDDGYEKADGLDPKPIFVPPLQQDIELQKAAQGKDSEAIDKITSDDVSSDEQQEIDDGSMERFRKILGLD
jgi:hypothetical protein|tara:strand:+ start:10372 stop:10668 length:297 start_codon:yes stop_codon:yes gene_type:complete